jgi:hypothetical protein
MRVVLCSATRRGLRLPSPCVAPGGRGYARVGRPSGQLTLLHTDERTERVPLAIAGTGFGLIGILVIILLVVLILYFVRRV